MVLTGFILDEIVAVRPCLGVALILAASEILAGGIGRRLFGD